MARAYQINGESLLLIRFGAHMVSGCITGSAPVGNFLYQLGLAERGVMISPNLNHMDVLIDDFGPNVPPEVLWNMADCIVTADLVHYDRGVLDACLLESMGGGVNTEIDPALFPLPFAGGNNGTMMPAGTPLGNWCPFQASGNHYMSLNITSPQENFPWRFLTTYMPVRPFILPVGTKRSVAQIMFRAIPYQDPLRHSTGGDTGYREQLASGSIIWDHTLDT